jgi:hypothetical protein
MRTHSAQTAEWELREAALRIGRGGLNEAPREEGSPEYTKIVG